MKASRKTKLSTIEHNAETSQEQKFADGDVKSFIVRKRKTASKTMLQPKNMFAIKQSISKNKTYNKDTEAKLDNVVGQAQIVSNIARKASKWRTHARKKTASRNEIWEAEDKLAASSSENRDEEGNLLIDLEIYTLQPNIGTKEGGQLVHVHGNGFDHQSYEQGRMWLKWGQYQVPIIDFIDLNHVTCRQPAVPILNTQDMRRLKRVHSTAVLSKDDKKGDDGDDNDDNDVNNKEEQLYFLVSITSDNGLNFSKPKPYYISPQVKSGTVTEIYDEMNELMNPRKSKQEKKDKKEKEKKEKENKKEKEKKKQQGEDETKEKGSRKRRSSRRGSIQAGIKRLLGSKKQVKYVEVDNTKVNGVIVWGKNSKSNTLKVGTDLIADSFNELATSLAISSASQTKGKDKIHKATLRLKGSPVPHPRYIQFRTCLHITRLLSICTGGLIDVHSEETKTLQFVFAAEANTILARKKRKNEVAPRTLADLVVATILAYETKRAYIQHRISQSNKKHKGKRKYASSSYPLQPPKTHVNVVKLFLQKKVILNFISYAVEHAHLLFDERTEGIRDIKISSNNSTSDPSLQMVLHESGFVSMRCDSSIPSMFAQELRNHTLSERRKKAQGNEPFILPGKKGATDQNVTVTEIRIPLESTAVLPKVATLMKGIARVPIEAHYPTKTSWLSAMDRYANRVETLLWGFSNRGLFGRARRTHRGVLLPSVTRVFEPGSGWFFSKSLSFGRAFQKIQHISCGNAHFCAITSKMDGAQLYTWGSNKYGQLGRLTGKSSLDVLPGIVHFLTVDEHLLEDEDEQQLEKGHYGAVNRVDSEFRLMSVTHVSCGPEYTVCAGIGNHDGVTSMFSWGKTHVKPRRVSNHVKFRTVGENPYVSHLASGIPHDIGKALPQEVLRLRPHRKLSSSIVAALKFKTRVSDSSFISSPLLFFPLRMSQFCKSEWKRWMFSNREAVKTEIKKSEFSSFHRAVEGRFKRLSSRSIPVLENREKALHHKFSQDLRKFGESCDRTAIMKQRLINDASSILRIPCSNSELESFINVDDVILSFVQNARRNGTISPLEPLCFKPAKNQKEADSRSLRYFMHQKEYTIPNDSAWVDILLNKQDAESELLLTKTAFVELWQQYCVASQKQEELRACYSVMKTAAIRNECEKGTRPGYNAVDPFLLYELLMEPLDGGKQQIEQAEHEAEKKFLQRSRSGRRGSVAMNPRSKGSVLGSSSSFQKQTSSTRNMKASTETGGKSSSSSSWSTSTSTKQRANHFQNANQLDSPLDLALRMTGVWSNDLATANRESWKTWSSSGIQAQYIFNIRECHPCPYQNELDSVLDVLLQNIRDNDIQLTEILQKAKKLEKSIDESSGLIDLYTTAAEDWILAHIIDEEKDFPPSNIHLPQEKKRLGVNTSTQYIHAAYKRAPTFPTGFQNRLEKLQDHWGETNKNCMLTGQYGLAKKFALHQATVKEDQNRQKHDALVQKRMQTMANERSTTSSNQFGKTAKQIKQAKEVEEAEKEAARNKVAKKDAFIPGSTYSLQDFLNMSTNILKDQLGDLSTIRDDLVADDDDDMMHKVIEMIADTAHLRTWNNMWLKQQIHSALHQLNELETFVPERAKVQWSKERKHIMSQSARGVGRRQRKPKPKPKPNSNNNRKKSNRRRSMTMEKLRAAQTGGNDLFAAMNVSMNVIDEGEEGEWGNGNGKVDEMSTRLERPLAYTSEDNNSEMEEPLTDVESYVYKNHRGQLAHSGVESGSESSAMESDFRGYDHSVYGQITRR